MSNIINPGVGIVFKKIFGIKKSKDILIAFINSIVNEEDQVNGIKLLNPYNEHDFEQERFTTIAIKALNKLNNKYIIDNDTACR